MQLSHVKLALRIYTEASAETRAIGPHRRYLDWAIQRATRILDEVKQMVAAESSKDSTTEPGPEATYNKMCAEYVDAFWDSELGITAGGSSVKDG